LFVDKSGHIILMNAKSKLILNNIFLILLEIKRVTKSFIIVKPVKGYLKGELNVIYIK